MVMVGVFMAYAKVLDVGDKIISELATSGGSMPRRAIMCHMKIKQDDLDPVLDELEKEQRIKRTDLKIGKFNSTRQVIILKA